MADDATPLPPLQPASEASITILQSSPTHTFPTETPPPVNLTPMQIGIYLNLLQTAILQGTPTAASIAQTTLQLATTLNYQPLTDALTTLTTALPPTGAPTLTSLHNQLATFQTNQPNPQPLQNPNQAPSWLAPIITIRRVPTVTTPTDTLTPLIQQTQLLLTEGNISAAQNLLTHPKFVKINTQLTTYQTLQTALTQALNAYQTYLTEATP